MKLRGLPADGSHPELWQPASKWRPPVGPLPRLRGVRVALDTETRDDGLARDMGPGWVYDMSWVCGVSAAWGGEKLYVPLRHPDTECRPNDEVVAWLEDILRECEVHFFNMGYDMAQFRQMGVQVWPERAHDASIMAVMLDENQNEYNLDACCRRAGVSSKDQALLEEAARSYGVDPKAGLWQMPARYVGPYAEQDAASTLDLCQTLLPQIDAQRMRGAYQTEIDLVPVLYDMRKRGIPVDTNVAEQSQQKMRGIRDEALAELSRAAGRRVTMEDVNSGERIGGILSENGVVVPRTKPTRAKPTGMPSVQKEWLKHLDHPMGMMVRRCRQFNDLAEKFFGTYILGFAHRGRIHATVHQLRDGEGGARTMRLSYSDPPLHQMPARAEDEETKKIVQLIRDAFFPERGEIWASPDYCFADDTEILTRDGFVLLRDLPERAECAQVDLETRVLSYALPTARQTVRYAGDMVHLSGRQTDLLMTPNHRCPLYMYETDRYEVFHAEDVLSLRGSGNGWDQLGAATYLPECPLEESESVLRLVVAAQADATLRSGASGHALRWQLRKERKIARLLHLLDQLGVVYSYTPAGHCKASVHVAAQDVPSAVWRWMSTDKTLSRDMLRLTPELRRVVTDELPRWDGSGDSSYGSSNLANSELCQELIVTTGRKCTSSKFQKTGRKPHMAVSWSQRDRSGLKNTSKTVEHYDGTVYCVTMPLSTVVVRRNGKVSVTGNSGQEPRIMVHLAEICGIVGASVIGDIYRADPDTDYHTMVAGIIGLKRSQAKDINQGLAYGMGLDKLARVLSVSTEEAQEMLKIYERKLPYIGALTNHCSNLAKSRGWVKLLDGARCHFDEWQPAGQRFGETVRGEAAARARWPGTRIERAYTYRAANRGAQGGAARQMKRAMVECHRARLRLLVQMHDELGISCAEEREARLAREIMIHTTKLTVPVKVDLEVGPTWGQAKTKLV